MIENWLREPPEWFLNVLAGVVCGLFAGGFGLLAVGVTMLTGAAG